MSALKYSDNIALLRSIQRELKHMIGKDNKKIENFKDDVAVKHMFGLMRENQVTEKRFCRPANHYKYFAQTYLTYLRSSRIQTELTSKYFNKGDKSVEESARLVGLKLPKQDNTTQ